MTGFTYRAETCIYKAFMKTVASCGTVEIYMGLYLNFIIFMFTHLTVCYKIVSY